MSYRPPPRSRGESALSKRRSQRRQNQARLVAVALLLTIGIAVLLALVLGIRTCAGQRGAANQDPAHRVAHQGGTAKGAQSSQDRSPAADKPKADAAPAKGKEQAAAKKRPSALKQLSKRRFKPAPFAIMHDGKSLYVAQDTTGFSLFGSPVKEHPDLYQLDSLSAYPLAGGKRSWEAALEASYSELGLAAGNVVLFNPYEAYARSREELRSADELSLPDNAGLMLTAFDATSGTLVWNQSIRDVRDSTVTMDSKAVVVAYRDGAAEATANTAATATTTADAAPASLSRQFAAQLRLAAFNAKTGEKAWNGAPNLKNLQTDQLDASGAALKIDLQSWEGLTAYICHNIAGLLQSGNGSTIFTYTAPGYIYATAYDVTVKTFYVLHAGGRAGQYELAAIRIGGKKEPKLSSVGSFESASEHFLLLAEGGFVAVALQTALATGQKQKAEGRAGSQQLTTRLLCYRTGGQSALLNHQFASGEAVDLASVPGVAGEFLIALAEGLDDRGQPRGKGSLYRARSQDSSVWEVSARREPVAWLLPYRTECLLLYKGGQVQRYIPESNTCVDLARGIYPFVEPTPGRSRTPAVLSSYPLNYLLGKRGQQMQVMVFE